MQLARCARTCFIVVVLSTAGIWSTRPVAKEPRVAAFTKGQKVRYNGSIGTLDERTYYNGSIGTLDEHWKIEMQDNTTVYALEKDIELADVNLEDNKPQPEPQQHQQPQPQQPPPAAAPPSPFQMCCLTEYANKKTSVDVYTHGIKANMFRKSCELMATVVASECADNTNSTACKDICVTEFRKFKKYHELIVADQKKFVGGKKGLLAKAVSNEASQKQKLDKANAWVKKIEADLKLAKESAKTNAELHQNTTEAVEAANQTLAQEESVMDGFKAEMKKAEYVRIPEDCAGKESCCCPLHGVPVRVPMASFVDWQDCDAGKAYTQSMGSNVLLSRFSLGGDRCEYLEDCQICRAALCGEVDAIKCNKTNS